MEENIFLFSHFFLCFYDKIKNKFCILFIHDYSNTVTMMTIIIKLCLPKKKKKEFLKNCKNSNNLFEIKKKKKNRKNTCELI